MNIYLDMDGVIVRFVRGVFDRYGYYNAKETDWNSWHMPKKFDVTDEQFHEFLKTATSDWWATLKRYDWAPDILQICGSFDPNFKIITAAPTENARIGKSKWLKNHCVRRDVIFEYDKWKHSAPGRVLIDDKPENVTKWAECGGFGILWERSWNSDLKPNERNRIFAAGSPDQLKDALFFLQNLCKGKNVEAAKPTKPTNPPIDNPKDICGIKKASLSCTPMNAVFSAGRALVYGASKYGRYNWRDAGVRSSVYYDAALRHLTQWWEGEDEDEDSGLSHIDHAIAGLLVVRDSMLRGNLNDDRPKGTDEWIEPLNDWTKRASER